MGSGKREQPKSQTPAAGSAGGQEKSLPPAVILVGPTASGKSALGLALAKAFDGVIINADSLQVYEDLRVISARPDDADLAQAPHRLYGTLPAREACTAGRWRSLALKEMAEASAAGKLPILVGGTGLYLSSLVDGLSPMPQVPPGVREAARTRFEQLGREAFIEELRERDPVSADRLHANDTQRLLRAWEVFEASGEPLSAWQEKDRVDAAPYHFLWLAMMPDRDRLYDNCNRRFEQMVEQGALEEVRALIAQELPEDCMALRALGVPELADYLAGRCDLDEAVAAAQQSTRRYAKRQLTWLKTQVVQKRSDNCVTISQQSESLEQEIFPIIRQMLLTHPTTRA
ncbi:tRNA (adenosine(37)-N6)-dimethylallyltransferase MiaA [Rhodovibrionaceae bacterium A322]